MSKLTDIFRYFAKYPDKQAVLDCFSHSTSIYPDYSSLKSEVKALPDPVLPDIKHFIISTSEKVVGEKIKEVKDFFMLVEYGPIHSTSPNNAGVGDTSWHLAVNIGHKLDERNTDLVEETLLSDACLSYAVQLIQQMVTDSEEGCGFEDLTSEDIDIAPIEPTFLYGSLG